MASKPAGRSTSPTKKPAASTTKAAGAASASSSGTAAAAKPAAATAAKPAAATAAKPAAAPAKAPAKPAAAPAKATAAKTPAAAAKPAAKPAAGKAAPAKPGAKPAAGKPGAKPAAAAAKPKDPKDLAATRIQTAIRGFLARRRVARLREERKRRKAAQEEELEKLRQAAWVQELEYTRKQEKKRAAAEKAEREKRAAAVKLQKDLLEAAYDGEEEDLRRLLQSASDIDIDLCDSNGNSLLSEAAAGGHKGAVELLLSAGADPNKLGEFGRTPLFRACFLGRPDVIRPLLEAGADPRTCNDGGETCASVANGEPCKAALAEWDIARTDALAEELRRKREARAAAAAAAAAKVASELQGSLEGAQREHDAAQQALKKAYAELEKRISEHDTCVAEQKPDELVKVTLSLVHEAEETLDAAKARAAEAAERLQDARLAQRKAEAAAKGEELDEDAIAGAVDCEIRDLDDVLIKDVGGLIQKSGKWPLVVDVSQQASVFLRYLDSNYVNACSATHMQRDKLRKSLLGAIRYGKPFVVDFMAVDLCDEFLRALDEVQPNLAEDVLSRGIAKGERYLSLVRPGDGEEYDKNNFQAVRVERFMVVFLTAAREPNARLLERCYALRVKVSAPGAAGGKKR